MANLRWQFHTTVPPGMPGHVGGCLCVCLLFKRERRRQVQRKLRSTDPRPSGIWVLAASPKYLFQTFFGIQT